MGVFKWSKNEAKFFEKRMFFKETFGKSQVNVKSYICIYIYIYVIFGDKVGKKKCFTIRDGHQRGQGVKDPQKQRFNTKVDTPSR